MTQEITKSAPSIEEAVDAALEELGVQADGAEFEVLEQPGRAGGDATVRVWVKEGYLDAPEPEDESEEDPLPVELTARPREELPELTEEELDHIADTAVNAIQSILGAFGIEATIDEYEGDEGEIILDIVGGELGLLIGRHGKTLDSLQTLVAAITSRQIGHRFPVVVDVEGYRGRRREKLEDIARRTSDRVSRQGRAVKLRPMTSYERRVIHMTLREDRRVVTGSEGDEPFRSVVVSPK
ncbi:MAG: RNA-binding cell elongation regulator Jag/EloR [Coriobacteriia bacterium]|jgi:spoIIIJ-associated protein|nr:RNA-binding cell elongation regulator Jag/EloR [Coriobacteriia bacterium]